MQEEYVQTKISEISGQQGNISIIFRDYPVKQVAGENEFKFIRDEFGLEMIEKISAKHSFKTQGLFKKVFLCPVCNGEIDIKMVREDEITDSVDVDDQRLNYVLKAPVIICSSCSAKVFAPETEKDIYNVIVNAFTQKGIQP